MDYAMPLRRCIKRRRCRIEDLSDELLIAILSRLDFHEAARSCILSRRWRYLWKHTTGCSLQFYNDRTWDMEIADRFIASVNQVLRLHPGASIHHFKACFKHPLLFEAGKQHEIDSCIDAWINFAIGKQVKVFELNLAPRLLALASDKTYCIPHVQKLLSVCGGEVKLLTTLSTLTSVRFVHVRITQQVVEFLLSNCPFLEHLCISASDSLENLEVVASLPKLRSMEISHCKYLKNLKVRAPSLVSFTYVGFQRTDPVSFEDIPLLSKLTSGGYYAIPFIRRGHEHSSYCRNLKRLKLEVSSEVSFVCKEIPQEFPQLCHLKTLELDITTEFGDRLCFYIYLTKCAPQLSRLTIR